ncbi:hypothetical protein PoMZ_11607, partial [Pyricularia oryzae]
KFRNLSGALCKVAVRLQKTIRKRSPRTPRHPHSNQEDYRKGHRS